LQVTDCLNHLQVVLVIPTTITTPTTTQTKHPRIDVHPATRAQLGISDCSVFLTGLRQDIAG
ncbi:MAG: hypothetical protein J4N90_12455, partial [Chloroflexi bacterium]|nr:hypothetical protein [Chloroflexota bacterium]